ncbi:MAG: DUF2652 domain-containing protein [Marivirga sp.]|nr:DUF2652 domain-containing protein [Marivirga sp.]
MTNKGLLFIPDISGFTRFITETEIEHSRVIIQELLELLINANEIGLEVSEIEGDAILFYKYGECPDVETLYRQVAAMFCAFHRHIGAYDQRRFCQCEACNSVFKLSLKVITHYGEFTGYNVKNFNKLIGRDVIVAHQLLKNDIDQHEYWLVTNELSPGDPQPNLPTWISWSNSVRQTESGAIPFKYALLSDLRNGIKPDPLPLLDLSKKAKVLSFVKEYDASILAVFHASGDFNYRSRWQEGVKSVEEVNHFLPRVGMRCRCILDNGQDVIYASSYTYTPDRIEFSETEETKDTTTYYTLEKIDAKKTRLSLDYYIPNGIAERIFFTWMKKKNMEEMFVKSLQNLDPIVKEIRIPEEQLPPHQNRP